MRLALALAIALSSGTVAAQTEPAPTTSGHLCRLRVPIGFLGAVDRLRESGGRLSVATTLAGGEELFLLGGGGLPSGEGPPAGEDLQVLERIEVAQPGYSGALELVQLLVRVSDVGERAQALVAALATGGAETRHRAALDLASDERFLDTLADESLAALREELRSCAAGDPVLPILLGLYAVCSATDRVQVCLGVLGGSRGERCLPRLRSLLALDQFPVVPADLEPHLAPTVDAHLRRRATHLLARLGGDAARGRLLELLQDEDPDVASESLVGLAGRAPEHVLASCRDCLLAALDTSRPPPGSTPVEQVRSARDLQTLRTQTYSGGRFRLMASGFILARASAADRVWLESKLPLLRDASASVFLRHALASPWADFEEAW